MEHPTIDDVDVNDPEQMAFWQDRPDFAEQSDLRRRYLDQ